MAIKLPVIKLQDDGAKKVTTSNPVVNSSASGSSSSSSQAQAVDVQSLDLAGYNAFVDQMLIDKGLYYQANKDVNGDGVIDENDKATRKTGINGEKEANFADYGAALDDWLKEAIINGGSGENESEGIDDKEQAIYDKLAGIFQNRHVLKTNDFMSYARQMGFEVTGSYMETDYIVDNKADGNYHKTVKENGHIFVMTIKDPETGADIVIADANGNASIEVEELFLNEILTGLSSQIDPSQYGTYTPNASYDVSESTISMDNLALGESLRFSAQSKEWLENETQTIKEEAQKAKKAEDEEEKEVKEEDKKEQTTIVTKSEYDKLEQAFIEEYIEELKEDSDYADFKEDELAEIAQKEANEYMEDNYKIE